MKLIPSGNRVVVERKEGQTKKGSLYIPDAATEKPQLGTIISVGDGEWVSSTRQLRVRFDVGDTVMFGKYTGSAIEIDNKEYLVINAEDILGRVIESNG